MQTIEIRNTNKGEYIKRKADALTVYVRGEYDRATKSFCCYAFDDISKCIYIKANKPVFIGFDF